MTFVPPSIGGRQIKSKLLLFPGSQELGIQELGIQAGQSLTIPTNGSTGTTTSSITTTDLAYLISGPANSVAWAEANRVKLGQALAAIAR